MLRDGSTDPGSGSLVVSAGRLVFILLVLGFTGSAAPAEAQYSARSDSTVGERYHVEVAYAWWRPEPELVIASASLGILGSNVDLVNDLGVEKQRLSELRLVLRPGTKHKIRFAYLPITYDAETILQREFVFNGQRYRVGLPVATTAEITNYRFGYEYDFAYFSRGYLGAVIELKYDDVNVRLDSPIGAEFTSQKAPIPTFGLAGRGYLTSHVSITGEFSYFNFPNDVSDGDDGRYLEFDFYGTANFTNNVGAQLGYRTIDVFYQSGADRGDLKFKGWYFGGVVRF